MCTHTTCGEAHLLCSLRIWTRWFKDCRSRAGHYEAWKGERNSSLAQRVSREDQSAESSDGSVAYACRDATTQSLRTVKETLDEAPKPGKSLRGGISVCRQSVNRPVVGVRARGSRPSGPETGRTGGGIGTQNGDHRLRASFAVLSRSWGGLTNARCAAGITGNKMDGWSDEGREGGGERRRPAECPLLSGNNQVSVSASPNELGPPSSKPERKLYMLRWMSGRALHSGRQGQEKAMVCPSE
ncbi:unnamed protein product [Protopolystoma xenopodis]|uniref:Uncharacterized protein n=1 Tax=Protopolystoma xenopodis TaxID=117903 RepID=A0A3S5FDY4_9PLAT|nr:unnamed protein product [Protopolystoma xenopodis]